MFPNLCQTNLRWGTQTLRDHGIFAPIFWKVPSNVKIHPPSKASHVFFHMYFLFYSRTSGCLLTHALWKLKKKKTLAKGIFLNLRKRHLNRSGEKWVMSSQELKGKWWICWAERSIEPWREKREFQQGPPLCNA